LVKVTEPESQFKFNVEKTDTFIIVGGTASSAREFTIVPNNGSEFILENEIVDVFNDEELGEEYSEGEYLGTEEDLLKFEPGESLPDGVDVESLNNLKGFDPNNPDESLSTDSSSKYPVSKDKDANIKAIIKVAKEQGVKNKYTIAAILSIVSKESGFIPSGEASYSGTPAQRIRKIFGSRFKGYSDAEIDVIKKNPTKFFDIIYGGRYGNASNEGFKYRGRGFNQITFKGNYEVYAKETGLNFIKDPDLLNTVDGAAAALIAYFKRNIKKANGDIKKRYNFTDINSFSNLNDATGAIYHANAGWGKSYSEIVADSTGGRKKAFNAAGPLYNTYQSQLA
jgi:putative chitinase